jgi:hydroxyacylglutathione hydrolase
VIFLPATEVKARQRDGVTLLDTRAAAIYSVGHVPGSLQIGLGEQFALWAGTLIAPGQELILVTDDPASAEESRSRLAALGIERVLGGLQDGVDGWDDADFELAITPHISVRELHTQLSQFTVLDVRGRGEFETSHIPGAQSHPLENLRADCGSFDPAVPFALHCKSGYRSSIACSILEAAGFSRFRNVAGGFDAWTAAGFPT